MSSPWPKFKISPLLISAILLRIFFAAFFYHPDIKSQYFHGSFLSAGQIDVYSFIQSQRDRLPYTDTFNYPPLIYFFLGVWYFIARTITGPGLLTWLYDWGPDSLAYSNLFSYLLILKLPYFLADFLVLKLLSGFFSSAKNRQLVTFFWLFNPLSLYAIYAIGQFDILPVLLTVAAVSLTTRQRILPAVVLLAIGGSLKTYPLLLIPFVVLKSRNWRQSIVSLLAGGLAYLLPMLPFLDSAAFTASVFRSSLAAQVLVAGWYVGSFTLPYFLILYLAVFFLSLNRRKNFNVWGEFLAITLGVIMFSRFHPQWLLWSLPFLAIFGVKQPRHWPVIGAFLLAAVGSILLLKDKFMLIGLFTAANSQLVTIPPIVELLPIRLLPFLPQALLIATLLFGLMIIYRTFRAPKL